MAVGAYRMKRNARAAAESPRPAFWAFFILIGCLSAYPGTARSNEGFTGGVTPSRFEISASPGTTVRRSIEIYNLGQRPAKFTVATADWMYSETGRMSYSQQLVADSCRPWVRLEAHEVTIVPDPRQARQYRFEVHVPDDAPPQECRFALMIESRDMNYTTQFQSAGISMPVSGRLAVIVYLAVGDVAPELVLEGMEVQSVRGSRLPVVKVSNRGTAHGRLDADLAAVEAGGKRRLLSLSTSPILAGQTRYMAISPVEDASPLRFPLQVEGKIYAPGATFAIDSRLQDAPPEPES